MTHSVAAGLLLDRLHNTLHPPVKRQRTFKTQEMAMSTSGDHTGAQLFQRGSRRGQSLAGGQLRLNVSSCLSQTEAEILGVLIGAVKLSKSRTVVRVAGGWVRDKLLGLEVKCKLIFKCVPSVHKSTALFVLDTERQGSVLALVCCSAC